MCETVGYGQAGSNSIVHRACDNRTVGSSYWAECNSVCKGLVQAGDATTKAA
jgi:hypothetical protein